jgi:cobalt-zinc-cadmium resistance protein CzcA
LKVLEERAGQIEKIMRGVEGIQDVAIFRLLGQPSLNVMVDRQQAVRYQINVADVQDAIQTAAGGNSLTQVLQGEARYDLVLRYQPRYRDRKEAIEKIRLLSPTGERVSLAHLCKIREEEGAAEIYREGNERYIAIRFSVRGRDLGGAVEEAIDKVNRQVQLLRGYHVNWEGEYESQKRSEARLLIIVPLTVFLIFMIIYGAFGSAKWACLHLVNVVLRVLEVCWRCGSRARTSVSRRVSGSWPCLELPSRPASSWSSISTSYARALTIEEAAIQGAVRRLRPIMMTMLVATLGLSPAAMSHAIGSDSQRPFAIVIVGGLIVHLVMSTFLLPTFYVWWARPTDPLPPAEEARSVYE